MNRRIATAMTIAAALIAPAAAKASPMNDSYAVNVSSASHNLGSYHLEGDHDFAHLFYVGWALDVTSKVTWTGSLPVTASWNSANVRQGAPLPMGRMAPMLQTGALHVAWGIKGYTVSSSIWKDFDTSTSVDASCAPQLLGSDYECTATSPSVYLARQSGMPNGPYVKLKLRAKFTVTPEGAIVSRSLTTAGLDPVTKSGLALSPAPATDNVDVPCAMTGSPVGYKLGPLHWTPAVSVNQQAILQMGMLDPVIGEAELPAFYDKPYGPVVNASPKFDLTGSAHTTALGTLLANNVAPTIAPMSFSANPGQTMQLHGDVSARCDITSYVWKFSDGTTAYGDWPAKTFTKSLTGQLKVTDSSGLSATRDFSVSVG